MLRKIFLLLIGLIIISSCSKPSSQVVLWKPQQPKTGDKITIVFNPQRLVNSEQQDSTIFMVVQLFQDQDVKSFRIPMTAKTNHWQAVVKTEPGAYLLRLKFEDRLDRAEDNDGAGWHVLIRDEMGNLPKNAHRKTGLMFSQGEHTGFVPDYAQALEEFKQELLAYPENYLTWYDIWEIEFKQADRSQQAFDQIKFQLDSLLTNAAPAADLQALAFYTYWKLFHNPQPAMKFGEQILSAFQDFPNRDEIEYLLIILKNEQDQEKFDLELIKLADRIKDQNTLKKIYLQLGFSFKQRQNLDEAVAYFKKYLELEPSNIPVRLDLANLHVKRQDFRSAQQMIDQAEANGTEDNYFLMAPWDPPEQRQASLNLDRCRIFSTRATLATAHQDFQQAIVYRKQAIGLSTLFPAFEWAKIGDLYFQLGQLDSAKMAYVKAISINPAPEEVEKLKMIYQQQKGPMADFYTYVQRAIEEELKASAKLAPDFELMDLDGNLISLSEQQGKIIVITFWDSWSSACQSELPQLNAVVAEFKNNPAVSFWAISVEAPVSIKKYISDNPFEYHHFHSGYPVKKLFNIIGFPTHLVIDPQRKIRYTHIGYSQDIESQLRQEIFLLLKESKVIS